MTGREIDQSPEKRGWINYGPCSDVLADEFVVEVAALAEERGIELRFVEEAVRKPSEPVSQPDYTGQKPELFTWATDPNTEGKIAIITRENIKGFDDGTDASPRAKSNRSSRFYSGIVKRSISDLDMDDGGYMLFAGVHDKKIGTLGIRVIRSLELLRKLKNGQIGEEKSDGSVGIKGVNEVGINFFERYCTALFPRVDIAQATLDLDKETDKQLARSTRRLKIWSWVGRQATGAVFKGQDAAEGAGLCADQSNLGKLEEIGLISRLPLYPRTNIVRGMQYHGAQFVKLHDDRWDDLNELISEATAA